MKSVLDNLPLYIFSLSKAPKSIIDTLEKLQRQLLWGGNDEKNKLNWVAWNVILSDKQKGGHGVGSLCSLNLGFLTKWIWRFMVDSSPFLEVCHLWDS